MHRGFHILTILRFYKDFFNFTKSTHNIKMVVKPGRFAPRKDLIRTKYNKNSIRNNSAKVHYAHAQIVYHFFVVSVLVVEN